MHFIITRRKFQRLLYGRPISIGYLSLQTGTRAKEACIVWFASLGYGEAFDFWQWGESSWNVEFKNEDPLAPINANGHRRFAVGWVMGRLSGEIILCHGNIYLRPDKFVKMKISYCAIL